jgi:hypothetical protein
MKQILLMIAVVALVGCGKKEQTQNSDGNKGATTKSVTAKPAKQPSLEEKIIGSYAFPEEAGGGHYHFFDNGIVETSAKFGTFLMGSWSIAKGEIVIVSDTGGKSFHMIEENGDLTWVGLILDGETERYTHPKEDQITWKKMKVSEELRAEEKEKTIAYIDTKIRFRIGKRTGTLTEADLEKVKSLTFEKYEEGESFEEGVDYSKYPYISDLTLLAKLTKLQKLVIPGNKITDLKPLASLTELQTLDLRRNKITDLSPLAELKQLKEVSLYANYITMEEANKLEIALPNCKIFHNADD